MFTALYRMARHRFARRRCTLCGCTDWKACPDGCAWLTGSIDVCTACRPGTSPDVDQAWRDQLAAMPAACRTAIEDWEGPLINPLTARIIDELTDADYDGLAVELTPDQRRRFTAAADRALAARRIAVDGEMVARWAHPAGGALAGEGL